MKTLTTIRIILLSIICLILTASLTAENDTQLVCAFAMLCLFSFAFFIDLYIGKNSEK